MLIITLFSYPVEKANNFNKINLYFIINQKCIKINNI